MSDDSVIDIRRYLGRSPEGEEQEEGAFSVWGGEGERSRFALPLWRAMYLVGGDWGGIVSLPRKREGDPPQPLFVLDLRKEPARVRSPVEPLRLLDGREVPTLVGGEEGELAVLLGEDEDRRWFLQIRGQRSWSFPEGKTREILLFLAGECAGLLFFQELSTPSPSSASAP